MNKSDLLIPTINLIGEPEENFYQLGLKDRVEYSFAQSHIKNLISTPWKPINTTIEEIGKLVIKQSLASSSPHKNLINAYSEGLSRPFEEVTLSLILPELLSFMSKWVPGISTPFLGCSSYFIKDPTNSQVLHGRVLDFPLAGTYDKYERAIQYQFKNHPKIFSYSTVGMPFPSLSAMTENGVSFALHQKFTEFFEPKGTPIFELIYELLNTVHDKRSALDFLKGSTSLTAWAFNMSFKNGDILSVDIIGDQIFYEESHIDDGPLYFNNQLIDKSLNQKDYLPYGIDDYNSMRKEIGLKKLKKLSKIKEPSQIDLLKVMGTPHKQNLKKPSNWKLDTLTPSTVALITFAPKTGESLYIPGEAPKYYRKEYISIENIWDSPKQNLKKSTATRCDSDYMQAMKDLMQAQVAFDKHDNHLAYHHIQMAIDNFKDYPEQNIAKFYFNIFQYLFEDNKLVRTNILKNFEELEDKLPPYLRDHCLLFISRLQRILFGNENIQADTFHSKKLRDLYTKEKKIPNLLLYKSTSFLMSPRIDLLDIIYTHIR